MLTYVNNVKENSILAAEVNYTAFWAFYTFQFYVNSNFYACSALKGYTFESHEA